MTLLRGATPADAAALLPLLAELGYDLPEDLLRRKLEELTSSAADAVRVSESERGIDGVVAVHLTPLFHAPGHLGRITALVVRTDARGRGIGRGLMTSAEEFCWESGCRRVELTSGDHRDWAHRFYEKLGYAVDSRRFIKHRPR
jgi:GNAT superfamily N-acetyltransferase